MKITDIKIEKYEKKFISKTKLGKNYFESRSGWYIKIYSDEIYGIGEACPLPELSSENHEDAGYALEGFKIALDGINYDVELEELLLLSDVHGFNVPSAQFAIQAAVYNLLSQINNQSVAKHLNVNHLDVVNINSIIHPQSIIKPENTKILKIKIDEKNIFSIKEKIENILKVYPDGIKIRLDFNGQLDLVRSIRVCKELEDFNIDYIEQPLDKNNIKDIYELRMTTSIPIALDESVINYNSVVDIINLGAADVLIIKPTLIGSFSEIRKIASLANQEGLRVIVTSSFESSVAQHYILNLISALEISEYCGVCNVQLFNDDIFFAISNSQYKIQDIEI